MDRYRLAWEATSRMLQQGRNFSGHERNCVFLNCGVGKRNWGSGSGGQGSSEAVRSRLNVPSFANVSAVTGLDFDDDARALGVVDWDLDGDLDLWLGNRSGPRLRFMRNEVGTLGGEFVAFRLRGTRCNRDGIGARVEVILSHQPSAISHQQTGDTSDTPRSTPHGNQELKTKNQKLIQTLYAGDAFLSQSSKWLHFGLGKNPRIDRVVVRWPGGGTETFRGVEPGRWYELKQGAGQAEEWFPPRTNLDLNLSASTQVRPEKPAVFRAFLDDRLPVPTLRYRSFDGGRGDESPALETVHQQGRPLLINFWASWCGSCVGELKSFTDAVTQFKTAGLDVLALTVDGMGPDAATSPDDAEELLRRIRFPFAGGIATTEMLDKFDLVQQAIFSRVDPFGIPISFLLDRHGWVAAVYRGQVDVEQLLADVLHLDKPQREWREWSTPFAGRWTQIRRGFDPSRFARRFADRYPRDVQKILDRFRDRLEQLHGKELTTSETDARRRNLSEVFASRARNFESKGQVDEAIEAYGVAVALGPADAALHESVGRLLQSRNRTNEAISHLKRVVEIDPDRGMIHVQLGILQGNRGNMDEAIVHFQHAARLHPDDAVMQMNLGIALGGQGRIQEALMPLAEAVRLAPDDVNARFNLGSALQLTGRHGEAVAQFRYVVQLKPDWIEALVRLSGLLSQGRSSSAEQTNEAIEFARRATELSGHRDPMALRTLAAAYAAAGEYDQAAGIAQMALDLVEGSGNEQLVGVVREQVENYQRAVKKGKSSE